MRPFPTLALLFAATLASVEAQTPSPIRIDATVSPPPPTALAFATGGTSPDGHVLGVNSRYFTRDGKPWFPVMGEFHYARYPADEWEREILKMKAGGITVISTYIFWLFHEETQDHFDWSGQRDLHRFVELCGKHGLLVWIRVGPWDHGEARNGGFPDWLVASVRNRRSNDPAYLARVKILFDEIGKQVKGQFWQDGGPIAGVQIENEYHPDRGGPEHMTQLLKLAHEAGINAPFYTATGWDNATIPATGFLPVFGGYTEQFWSNSLTELPPNENFFFDNVRAEDNVMGDLSPKNPAYNAKYDGFPFLTAEMGGGMAIAYHRRPLMFADDSTAAALVKLGSGITGLGYYMYHGGTNPDGKTPLQETTSQPDGSGYNDMEQKSYDFQAPLGEFGQVNPSYHTMRLLHLFLNDFGDQLAPMTAHFPAQMPRSRDDATTPRVTARTDGNRGFVFINNYERTYPLGDKKDFQVALKLPAGEVKIPRTPVTIPSGAYTFWPVNLDVGGVTLNYATAELVCRLGDPDTLVFFEWPGLPSEFAFQTAPGDTVEAPGGTISREGASTFVTGVKPGASVAIRVQHAGGKSTQVLVLSRAQALTLYKAPLAGRDRLVLTTDNVDIDGNAVSLTSHANPSRNPSPEPDFFPPLSSSLGGGRNRLVDYAVTRNDAPLAPVIVPKQIKPAAPSVAAKMNPNARRKIATEPTDADFDRAAVWEIKLPAELQSASAGRVMLQINYEGDVARLYAGNRLITDNFFKGKPFEIGLWRLTPEELKNGLTLKILPLRQDTPLYLPPGARPAFPNGADALSLKSVRLVQTWETSINVVAP